MSAYKISTLLDILQLENDQIDRLCKELPEVLKSVKEIMAQVQCASGQLSPVVRMLCPLTWIDDGKSDIICELKYTGEDKPCADVIPK